MTPIFRNNLGAAGYIIILQLVIIGFFGILFIGTQLQSIDVKQIALQNQETANDTNEILNSGRAVNILLQEIRHFENLSEERSQRLLPPFERFMERTALLLNESQSTDARMAGALQQTRIDSAQSAENDRTMFSKIDVLNNNTEKIIEYLGLNSSNPSVTPFS